MKLLVATLFLSGVLSVLSAPFNSVLNTPISTKCDTGPTLFHPTKTLLYEYEGETTSGLVGTSEERTGLKLKAKCQITPVLPCVYKLKVTAAELLESQGKNSKSLVYELSSGSSDLRQELLARDLYFETNGGMITNIRTEAGEPTHILNMKRGILSAFQLKLIKNDDTVTEVDVAGECRAKYHVTSRHESGKVKTIVKTKNLSECVDRSNTNLGFPTTPYPTNKPFSLLNSRSSCSFTVSKNYHIGKVNCKETHLFRPFSSSYNNTTPGAMTTVRQSVKLIRHTVERLNSNPSLPDTEKMTLKYEHTRKEEGIAKNYREVGAILEKLVSEGGVKPDSGRLFSKLIFAIRRSSTKTLNSVWVKYTGCLENGLCTKAQSEKYQTYFVDALSQCGTLECAQHMVNMITQKKVGTQQSVAFLTGIALVGRPSEDMVGNILFFCQETPSRTAFLTLGTIMHKYCTQHDCKKLNTRSSVNQADTFLRNKLRHDCQVSTPEGITAVTSALKAIGNAGRPFTAVNHILKCAAQTNATAISIEALQALRRMPCTTDMTNGLLDIFKSLLTDTEIRIETYLALMRCPSHKVINTIADVLDKEKNNQVGSFVWSHMTNALESTEPVYGVPLRNVITKALGKRKLRKFNRNHLRYSHAYETSYYNKKQELGGSSQGQLIFHPNSYFPRSARLNLTVDIFGASINLLETAGRFEGFESLIEQMFGTDGYFPDEHLMKLLNQKDNHRDTRSVNDVATDEIKRNLEELHDKIKIERKNPSGGLSFKVFGHELQFISFEDLDWLQGEADKINVIDTLINLARGGQWSYVKSFMFLEADHEVPTAIGFPLKLAVNGSAVSSLNLKGKFDIRNMFWGKKKIDIRGIVSPSVVIDISGKMSVDANHASSGLKINTTLYTATEINGNATFKEGEGIKLSVEPPKKPVYIVNVTSNLATYLNKKTQKVSGAARRFERQACGNFTRILGINVCGHVSSPMAFRNYSAPYFPLNGDSSFGLVYQTTNATLARFELEGRTLMSKDDNRYDWLFSMHVPGLTFGRRIEANSTFQFLEKGKYLSVSCGIHDYKFGKFEATYNNVTNGLHTKFSTPELSYLRPITIESEIFNKTNPETKRKDIGITINATYSNFTIQEVVTLFKHKDQYGFKSNLTYWPRKHISTEGRLSLLRKSAYLKVMDTSSKSHLFFVGKSGLISNKFYLKVGNEILNYEMKLDGSVNFEQKKFIMDMFTKPSQNLMKFEAYPRQSVTENGFYLSMLHVNSSSKFTGYLRATATPSERALKFSGIASDKPFYTHIAHHMNNNENKIEVIANGFDNKGNASLGLATKNDSVSIEYIAAMNEKTITSKLDLFKYQSKVGFNLHASILKQSFDVLGEYFKKKQGSGLHLKVAGADKTVDTTVSHFVTDKENGLKFTIEGMARRANLVAAYYKQEAESGLRLKGTVANKSIEFAAGLFTGDDEQGLKIRADILKREVETRLSILSDKKLRFVVNAMKKNLKIETGVFSKDDVRGWRVDALYNGQTTSYQSTYSILPTRKTLCSEMFDAEKTYFKICSQYIHDTNENAIDLSAKVLGRKAEMRTSLVHTDAEKGGQLKLKYNDTIISDIFMGHVSAPNYDGLRFRGTINEKTVDALFIYNNKQLKRSVDLQLHIQGHQVSFAAVLVRKQELNGIQINVVYQNKPAGSLFALLAAKKGSKSFRIGMGTAENNGIEYKFSMTTSKVEKTISSITTIRVNKTPYKYGGSISYTNQGIRKHANHLVTTKLHYSRNKVLTSTLHLVNNEHHINLISKMELVPGQHLTNKITYAKKTNRITAQYEFLPGLGITYEAAVVRQLHLLKLTSTINVVDYPMESTFVLDKLTGELKVKITYCPKRAPIEITTHLRTVNGIDMGLVLSAFNKTWNNNILVDYASKQMKIGLNVLPDVPINILAQIFGNDKIVLNVTTCSAFSLQLTGSKLADDDYQVILNHQYFKNTFEDLKLTINSLRDLRKLNIKWDAKSFIEIFRSMNVSLEDLLNNTIVRLSEQANKMTMDIATYLRTDGRDLLRKVMQNYSETFNIIKKQIKELKIDEIIEKSTIRVSELFKKAKEHLKNYGTTLEQTYNQLEKIIRDMTNTVLPHLRALRTDTRQWLWRSLERYRALSICGKTLDEMTGNVLKQAREVMEMFIEKLKEQYELVSENIPVHIYRKKFQELSKKLKMYVEEFTCNYELHCTIANSKSYLKKLADKIPEAREELVKLRGHSEKLLSHLMKQYQTMENHISTTINDKELREKVLRLIQPINDFIKFVRATIEKQIKPLQERLDKMATSLKDSKIMDHYRKMQFHSKELLKGYKEAINTMETTLEKSKLDLKQRIEEVKHYLETVRDKTIVIYVLFIAKIEEIRKMSSFDVQNLMKSEMKVNYEKMKNEFDLLLERMKTKVADLKQRYVSDRMYIVLKTVLLDVFDGRMTLKRLQNSFEKIVEELRTKTLGLKENAEKLRMKIINLYKERSEALRENITALYPKLITELKRLVAKVKTIVKGYVDRAKLRISELTQDQRVRVDAFNAKIQEWKITIMKKIKEAIDQYKKLNMDSVEKMAAEGLKMIEKYQEMAKNVLYKYKNELNQSAVEQYKKIQKDIVVLVTLYKDMPIKDIISDLRNRTIFDVEKIWDYALGKIVYAYEVAVSRVDMELLSTTWKTMLKTVRDMSIKYPAMAKSSCKEVLRYITKNFDMEDIQKIISQAKSYLGTRYMQMIQSYEKAKHIKFKEFHTKGVELLQKLMEKIKSCRDTCTNKVKEWKAKIINFVKEAYNETKNVAGRMDRINKDIWKDAVTTFQPYKVPLEDVWRKSRDMCTKKSDEFLSRYRGIHRLISEHNIVAKIGNFSIYKCPWLVKMVKTVEFIKDSMTSIQEYITKSSVVNQVRTHKLWPAMKQELLDHEIVRASKELKTSMKKLHDVSKGHFTDSMTRLGELNDQLNAKITGLKQHLLVQNEIVKQQLQEKRQELKLKFKKTHTKLKERGGKHVEDVRNLYSSGLEYIITKLEYFGEMSVHDVQKYLEEYLKPAKTTYNKLSDYIHENQQVFIERKKAVLHRVEELQEQTTVWLAHTKKWYKRICTNVSEWTTIAWKTTMSKAVKVEQLITKAVNKYIVKDYPSYNGLLKMTPNEILKHVNKMPYGETYESLKASARRLTAIINTDTMNKAKLNVQIGLVIVQSLLKDAEKQFQLVSTEIWETIVFISRFYGSETTVYRRHPELVEYAQNSYRMLANCSRAWTLKVLRFINKTSEMLVKLRSKYPELIEFVKTEMKDMDIKSVEKLKDFVNDNIKNYFPTYLESIEKIKMEGTKAYEKTWKKLSKSKEMVHKRYREMLSQMDNRYLRITALIEKARAQVTGNLRMTGNYMKTLIDKISKNVLKTMETMQDHVTKQFSSYENDIQIMKNVLNEMKGTVSNIIESVRETSKQHSPRIQHNIKRVFEAIQKTNWTSQDMMKPVTDALYELFRSAKEAYDVEYNVSSNLLDEMMTDLRPKILTLYKNNMGNAKTVFELCKGDLRDSWRQIRNEVETLWELKKTSILESSKPIRESLQTYYKKLMDVVEEARDANIKELVTKYSKTMSEKGNRFIRDVEERVREMVKVVKVEIQRMRKQAVEINEEIMRAVKDGKIRVLMNKTIEITEDLYEINPVEELVVFGKRFHTEYKNIMKMTNDNARFAIYIVKHVFRYNDLWEIIRELTSPFHWFPPSNSHAMIFGRLHVHTFDGQYYKFVGYKKPDCTYVLAKDIRDDSFTLLSKEKSLIITTKAGSIKIDDNGKVETIVFHDARGNKVNAKYDELPVEMKDATVIRDGNHVKINHIVGLKIVCNIKHFYCTFNVDKLYHGRLAGLLGTNNNEQYDRLLKPDKTLAKSEIEFANAWEVSGDPQCKVQDMTDVETPCKKTPSPRCKELFLNSSSPLAKYFMFLDPKPFYRACLFDTSDCKTDTSKTRNFCNVTAAYKALLKEKGVWAHQIPECKSCGKLKLWNEKPNKNVDVVLLIPETSDVDAHIINLPGILRELDGDLRIKYKPRYAIVGFGGKAGVHRLPHIVTGGSKLFGDINNAVKAIQHMSFTSEKADAFDTIDFIARMPFKPGASKIVLLLTAQHRNVTSSKDLASAIGDLKAQGIIFSVIGPYFQKKHENAFRLSKHQLKPNPLALSTDDYVRLAQSSHGGIFNLKAISSGQSAGLLKKAMKTTLVEQIIDDQTYCRTCICLGKMSSRPDVMCTVNRHRKCS